jgi:hypothetical protein
MQLDLFDCQADKTKPTMVKRPLPAFSLPMVSLHNAVVGSRTFLLFILVSSFVKASTAHSACRYGVWGVPSTASTSISSTTGSTMGRFGLPPKDNALCVRGGESSEEDKLLEEEDEIYPDEDEVVEIEVKEFDEEERLMEELEEVPSEADGGVDDEDDDKVIAEFIEELDDLTGQFDEDEEEDDDLDTPDEQEVAAKGFEEQADTVSVEPEKTWETPESSFSTQAAIPDQAMDDGESSAFVDRMELADAYDEGSDSDGSGTAPVAPVESSAAQEEAQESASNAVTEQQASVAPPTEIDAATKKILMKELKYRRSEVEKMRPDVAKIAANKRLQRPTEGVPVNWFVAGKVSNRNGLLTVLPKILVPVLVGALAVTTGISFDLSPTFTLPSKALQPSRSEEMVVSASTEDATEVDDDDTEATEEPESEPDVLSVDEHANTPSQIRAHSIKPGHSPADDLDVTWLDKGLSAVDRKIKAFLGWEI